MKVILLQDVKKLGKKGQIVEVSDGYARNFVLPQKLGVEANNQNLNTLKQQKAREAKEAAEILQNAKDFAVKLEEVTVVVKMKAGKDGKAFGSVSTKEIVEEAKKQFGVELDKKKLVLDDAIRTFGTYEVAVKLHQEVTGKIRVRVEEG